MKPLILLLLLFSSFVTYSQVFSNKEVGKKNEVLSDSLKKSEYCPSGEPRQPKLVITFPTRQVLVCSTLAQSRILSLIT